MRVSIDVESLHMLQLLEHVSIDRLRVLNCSVVGPGCICSVFCRVFSYDENQHILISSTT